MGISVLDQYIKAPQGDVNTCQNGAESQSKQPGADQGSSANRSAKSKILELCFTSANTSQQMSPRALSLLVASLSATVFAQTPSLHPTYGGGEITLRWDAAATGWVLESSSAVGAGAAWTRITAGVAVEGGNFVWSGASSETHAFFRLHNVGDPIVAPSREWTWVDFPDSFAMEGTTTGIGINILPGGTKVLIYLMGGGACWDEQTCYVLNTATHGPFGAPQFAQMVPLISALWGFNRDSQVNPFRDYSYVIVPYVTGDLHAGSNEINHGARPTKHVGFRNMTAYLRRLAPTFANATRVVLAGTSAGGFGAAFNWGQTQEAFAGARVDVLDDSGPFIDSGTGILEAASLTSWNLAVALPDDCEDCASNSGALFTYYSEKYPDSRAALLSFSSDATISSYFGIPNASFPAALDAFLAGDVTPNRNQRYYIASGNGHGLLPNFTPPATLLDFLARMLNDDGSWANIRP